jgi:hypothetical protein
VATTIGVQGAGSADRERPLDLYVERAACISSECVAGVDGQVVELKRARAERDGVYE